MIQNLFPALQAHGATVRDDEAEGVEKALAPKNGPARMRHLTNGQVRRMQERDRKRQLKKANRAHRRDFMARQQAEANIRGQIHVLKGGPGTTPAMRENVLRGLARKYEDMPGRIAPGVGQEVDEFAEFLDAVNA